MFGSNLLVIVESLEKFPSVSQLIIGNVMLIFRIVVKFGEKKTIRFLHMSCKVSRHFGALLRFLPGPGKSPVQWAPEV